MPTGSTFLIFLIELVEAINAKMKWFSKENILQVVHLICVIVYLILIYLDFKIKKPCLAEPCLDALAGGVVCYAWLDMGYSIRHLMFGRWPSSGLYVSLLMIVSQNIQLDIGY